MTSLPRDNNPAEIRAFESTCNRLEGFDPDISVEWVDGFLTALAAAAQVPDQATWLEALCGDNFERAFSDPPDHAQALRSLRVRLSVLLDQLNPEALVAEPEQMRLNPLMSEWNDAERERLVAEGVIEAEHAAELQTGALWADGFTSAVEAFADLWREPEDPELAEAFRTMLTHVSVLMLPAGAEALDAHMALNYPKDPPDREGLVMDACYAVQDLRVFQMDALPKPETRRVEKLPGRNDPCHCGSGKKFKKCHGAAT